MGYCTQCGSPVPDGQRTCSMCYGDIDHGKDGYYRKWAEDQERQKEEQKQLEDQERRNEEERQEERQQEERHE